MHIISAHHFPQSIKCEAIFQLFDGEAHVLRENGFTVLLLWKNNEQVKFSIFYNIRKDDDYHY